MFTGIIREIGMVEEVIPQGPCRRIEIRSDGISKEAKIGDSISVDGVCLTLVNRLEGILYFDVMPETLNGTTFGLIKKKDTVNLEPSMQLKDGLSGHLVSGHIDEVGSIKKIRRYGQGVTQLTIGIGPKSLSLLVKKASVAVNGISLTVNGIGRDFFIVDIIPHTFKATTMGIKKVGDKVNIEFDIIGKYVLKNLQRVETKTIDEDFLKDHGFI